MNEVTKGGSNFIGYEYKELSAKKDRASMYLDGYGSFGWLPDENRATEKNGAQVLIRLKRDRKILNKTELTRLQQHFEACMEEIGTFEKSKTSMATALALLAGLAGTAFMALATFAATNEPPLILPCILFAIPGFLGWGLPYFTYKAIAKRRTARVAPLIEQKYDEIYEICEKGNHLLQK